MDGVWYGMIWYALGVKQSVGLSTRHSLDPSFSLSWSLGGTGRPQLFGSQGGFLVHDNVVIAVEVDLEASVVAVLDNGHAGSKLRMWLPDNVFESITLEGLEGSRGQWINALCYANDFGNIALKVFLEFFQVVSGSKSSLLFNLGHIEGKMSAFHRPLILFFGNLTKLDVVLPSFQGTIRFSTDWANDIVTVGCGTIGLSKRQTVGCHCHGSRGRMQETVEVNMMIDDGGEGEE